MLCHILSGHWNGKFLRMSSFFKAVLVTGARQVGKTTMLKTFVPRDKNRTYISMDNTMARTLAQTDPVLFLSDLQASNHH